MYQLQLPHTPLQSEKADYDALSHIEDHVERTYAGMIRGLDRGIGQVLQALEEMISTTTRLSCSQVIMVAPTMLACQLKPSLSWLENDFFEGGIHTLFYSMPDQIPANSQYNSAVAHVDIFSQF